MKRLIFFLIMIVCIAAFTGCSIHKTADTDAEFLTSSDYWWFYDEVTGEYEKMSFSDDGTFYWGCECGEPVGDSDLYELYDFDEETHSIRLYNGYDDASMEMIVLDYSDYHLLLDQNGEIKDYTCDELGLDVANSEEYFKDYNMVGWIVDFNNGQAVVGPYDYDGDVEYPDNAMKAYDLAENVVFYNVQVRKVIYYDGEECEITYDGMTWENGMEAMEGSFCFIWFNDNMEIEKITYYGEVDVWE